MNNFKPGIECPVVMAQRKSQWDIQPDTISIIEFSGIGDPFFGGNARDLVLTKAGRLKDGLDVAKDGGAAEFSTIEAAHKAAAKIPPEQRRPGSVLGVSVTWSREPSVTDRYPRLFKALKTSCLLTETEAQGVLRGIEAEAVTRLGGIAGAIQIAWAARHKASAA